jgi:hypothetical protein
LKLFEKIENKLFGKEFGVERNAMVEIYFKTQVLDRFNVLLKFGMENKSQLMFLFRKWVRPI